ncbi:MAG: AAA family ATPase [Clostridia bacterium]|nr:AAA family ATPase [Clostridia bacterium]
MKCGICVCGLNGSGKTTLAGALAKELNFKHMDIEQYYFTSTDHPYSSSRTREEVERFLLDDIKKNPCFVFSAVNGDMTPGINEKYALVVYLDVSLDMRMKRIRQRAIDKFGDRVLPGGDMYEQEEKFFAYAEKRTPEKIENWLKTLSCKVIRLDGIKPIQENVEVIKSLLLWEKGDRASGG